MEARCLSTPMGWSYCLSPFILLRQALSRVLLLMKLSLVLATPWWPQKDWYANHMEVASCLESIKQLVRKAGFSRGVVEVIASYF